MASQKKLWFKAKRYGWGWYPSTWQGWAVTMAYLVFAICYSLRFGDINSPDTSTVLKIVIPTLIATIILLVICYLKGEKPGWRWGNKK